MLPPPAPDAYLVPDWPAPANVHALVTTRMLPGNSRPPFDAFNLGMTSGEDIGVVRANRTLLQRAFGLPSVPRWLRQVHGVDVVDDSLLLPAETIGTEVPPTSPGLMEKIGTEVPPTGTSNLWEGLQSRCFHADAEPQEEPTADAAVTRSRGKVLAVLTADCLPVLFCSDDGSIVGVAHAGWRGLAAGVLEATLSRLDLEPARVLAWLGPCIGAACYEVGAEVRDAFVKPNPHTDTAFAPSRIGHWFCDLEALARQRLAAAGVQQIFGGGFDTLTDPRLYSYRRDGERSGRFASLIWMDR